MPPVDPADPALSAPFRPRRGRRTATALAIAQGVLFVLIAALMQGLGVVDRIGMVAFGAALGAFLWRFAQLSVVVDERGLTVRNLAGHRRLAWAEVVTVRFGGGAPWVSLDLADGEPLAVMAIQRADGEFGEAEARRLATLVALHSRTARDD